MIMLHKKTLIIAGLCMSYNETFNDTVVGRCAFNYHYPDTQTFYVTLPNDTSQLNSFMCSGLNRTGLLCSQCQQGLGPAILSFKRQCVECFDQRYGWLLYITATLIPTTILCILTMAFQFNITSAEINDYFCFSLSDDNMCKYTCKKNCHIKLVLPWQQIAVANLEATPPAEPL